MYAVESSCTKFVMERSLLLGLLRRTAAAAPLVRSTTPFSVGTSVQIGSRKVKVLLLSFSITNLVLNMVIKMNSPPRPIKEDLPEDENLNPVEAVVTDPLRGVRASSGVNKAKSTEVEFSRLKNLVPSISRKQSVSQLDVILEAIRYIDSLQDQLIEQIQDRRLPVQAAEFLVGKENTIKVDQQQFKSKKEDK